MLKENDKIKIEQYISKLTDKIKMASKQNMADGLPNGQVINSVVNDTVNQLTPNSKAILNSVYNMLMEETLQEELFANNTDNEAAFYEMNIIKDLNDKFTFDIPKTINYHECKMLFNKWIAEGAIVVVGGVVTIAMGSVIPIGIAVIIAGIMEYTHRNKLAKDKQTVERLIEEYLNNVKSTLMEWVTSIETYYDERVATLKESLDK